MKTSVITMFFIAAILLGANIVHATSGQLESYYNDCITKKITHCELIASMHAGKSSSMIHLVEMRSAQAKFYRNHRRELIKEMVARNIGKKEYKIDFFLISKFEETG